MSVVLNRSAWQMFTEYGDEQETDPKDLRLKEVKVGQKEFLSIISYIRHFIQTTEKYVPRSGSSSAWPEAPPWELKKPFDRSESIIEAARRQQQELQVMDISRDKLSVRARSGVARQDGTTDNWWTGAIVIRGTEKQREEAWKLVKGVQATLPQLLTQLRENDIRKV
eukprot:768696-Hanusia_phi.AAC.2